MSHPCHTGDNKKDERSLHRDVQRQVLRSQGRKIRYEARQKQKETWTASKGEAGRWRPPAVDVSPLWMPKVTGVTGLMPGDTSMQNS